MAMAMSTMRLTHMFNLVGGLEHVFFIYILGMSKSQRTFIFFRVVGLNHQPGYYVPPVLYGSPLKYMGIDGNSYG